MLWIQVEEWKWSRIRQQHASEIPMTKIGCSKKLFRILKPLKAIFLYWVFKASLYSYKVRQESNFVTYTLTKKRILSPRMMATICTPIIMIKLLATTRPRTNSSIGIRNPGLVGGTKRATQSIAIEKTWGKWNLLQYLRSILV